ncbi:hypothetical protein PQX77_014278 [Marasmius sp. AFHP31]|nr:hypothetical protein PQX77_014278 [Marasmius sp. AFHP31]
MVNVEKSHIECEEFIKAEADRKAFQSGENGAVGSAYTGDAELKMAECHWRDPKRGPPKHGEKLNIGRMSKRTLESWASHYGVLHLAEDLPVDKRAMKYQQLLLEIQRSWSGALVVGQKMDRMPMSQSQWPNKKYKEKMEQAEAAGKGRVGRNIMKVEDQEDYNGAGSSSRFPKKEEVEEKKFRIKNEMGQGSLNGAGSSLHSRLPVKEEDGEGRFDVNDRLSGSLSPILTNSHQFSHCS